jgi:TM2 domain-containing membrane protein YozV
MNEKVWLIEDFGDGPGRRPADGSARGRELVAAPVKPRELHPALAFSLSALLWGGGQFYAGRRKAGLLYLLLMADFYAFLFIGWTYRHFAARLLEGAHISRSCGLAALGIFFISGLAIWMFGAVQAYYMASKTLSQPFDGVGTPLLPLVCSMAVPGWGQFLNGQAKKGIFFLFFAAAGFVALAALLVVFPLFPSLEPSTARLFLEAVLTGAVIGSPLILLAWTLSVHDAARVCLDRYKKEPLGKRTRNLMNNLRRLQWVRGAARNARRPLALGLMLAVAFAAFRIFFQEDFYVKKFRSIQRGLAGKHMVLLPVVMERVLPADAPAGTEPASPGKEGQEFPDGEGKISL